MTTPIDAPILRAGIIGLGIGRNHAKGYQVQHGGQVVAICDQNEARLQEIGMLTATPPDGWHTDYHRLLSESKPDIVSVCLPNSLHAEVTIAALESGAHVLCEKPMATSVADAQRMLDAARANGKQLMIAYNRRYRADAQWIKRTVEAGILGQIYHVNAAWRRETGIPGSGWFSVKSLAGGGPLIDLGVHILDLTMYFLGFPQIQTVSGSVRSIFGKRGMKTWGRKPGDMAAQGFDVEDGATAFIRFGNGTSMQLEATWAEHRTPQDDMIRIELQGSEATAVMEIHNYLKEDTLRLYSEVAGEPVVTIPKVKWEATYDHEALIVDALHSLRTGATPATEGNQGLAAVKILEALYQSARDGREVVL